MVLELVAYVVVALFLFGLGLYVVGIFNQMVGSGREIDRAFANVEVSLQQRHEEIPRLVEVCRGYMAHERDVLEDVTRLRSGYDPAGDVDARVVAENALAGQLSSVFAVAVLALIDQGLSATLARSVDALFGRS